MSQKKSLQPPTPGDYHSALLQLEELHILCREIAGIARTAPEINMLNYTDDEVSALNEAMCDIYSVLPPWSMEPLWEDEIDYIG